MSDDETASEAAPLESLAATRSRRSKSDKHGRFAALQKFKEAKASGKKFNYEVGEVQNVYEMVAEDEYVDEVNKKRDSAWIVDDDGGYVEDGREIFDDDEDDLYPATAQSSSKHNKKKDQTSKSKEKEEKGNKNIRNMLLNMPSKKKKEEDIKIEDDELLGDILGKLQAKPKQVLKPLSSAPKKIVHSDTERNPFMKRGTG